MNPELKEFDELITKLNQTAKRIPRMAAVEAVNFSRQRFVQQNWVDNTTHPWPKRKPGWIKESSRRGRRAILVDSGARLMRSIRVTRVGSESSEMGTDVPYAPVHNNGFRGTVRQTVREHTRKNTKMGIVNKRENKNSSRITFGRVNTGNVSTVRTHSRIIHQNIPRRRFIGVSAVLEKRLERMIAIEFKRTLKNGNNL